MACRATTRGGGRRWISRPLRKTATRCSASRSRPRAGRTSSRVPPTGLAQLYAADELFVIATVGGLVPVLTIAARQIGTTCPAPVPALLTNAVAALTAP